MKKKIKQWFMPEKPEPRKPFAKQKLTTVQPPTRPSESDWIKEFNVGLLHGKQAVFFG